LIQEKDLKIESLNVSLKSLSDMYTKLLAIIGITRDNSNGTMDEMKDLEYLNLAMSKLERLVIVPIYIIQNYKYDLYLTNIYINKYIYIYIYIYNRNRNDYSSLQTDLTISRDNISQYKRIIEETKRTLDMTIQSVKDKEIEVATLTDTISTLKLENIQAMKENESLSTALAVLSSRSLSSQNNTSSSSSSMTDKLSEEIEKLKSSNTKLLTDLQSQKNANRELLSMISELTNLGV
jgi:hypothetical protein